MKIVFASISKYLVPLAAGLLALLAASLWPMSAAAQDRGVVEIDVPEDIKPTLSIVYSPSNALLEVYADDDNLRPDSWQKVGPLTFEPDCRQDGLVYGSEAAGNRFLALTEADNGRWYCFKVSDEDDNAGYAKFQVLGIKAEVEPEYVAPQAVVAPRVSVERIGDSIQASSDEELANAKWQALIVGSASDCGASAFAQAAEHQVASASRIRGLSWRDNGSWYCFKVSDSGLEPGYGAILISGLPVPAVSSPEPSETSAGEMEADDDGDDAAVKFRSQETEGSDGQESAQSAATDESEEEEEEEEEDGGSDSLRLVGVAIVATGVMALIGILVFSRKPPKDGGETPEDEIESEEF